MDCSPPGYSVHGISQARILEWVAISFSSRSYQPRHRNLSPCIGRVLYHEPPGKQRGYLRLESCRRKTHTFWLLPTPIFGFLLPPVQPNHSSGQQQFILVARVGSSLYFPDTEPASSCPWNTSTSQPQPPLLNPVPLSHWAPLLISKTLVSAECKPLPRGLSLGSRQPFLPATCPLFFTD